MFVPRLKKPPHTQAGVQEQLAKYKAERLLRKKGPAGVEGDAQPAPLRGEQASSVVGSQVPMGAFEEGKTRRTEERLV